MARLTLLRETIEVKTGFATKTLVVILANLAINHTLNTKASTREEKTALTENARVSALAVKASHRRASNTLSIIENQAINAA